LGAFLLPPSWALLLGLVIPFLSSVLTGMPPLFPTAIQMIFELATYGLVVSIIYNRYRTSIYPALLGGMLAGRIIAGVINFVILTQFMANAFSLSVYLSAMFITAFPGIIVQLIIIPIMVKLLKSANMIAYKEVVLHND
jgi:predicted membrane protein